MMTGVKSSPPRRLQAQYVERTYPPPIPCVGKKGTRR
jgi:hypothetical protein